MYIGSFVAYARVMVKCTSSNKRKMGKVKNSILRAPRVVLRSVLDFLFSNALNRQHAVN